MCIPGLYPPQQQQPPQVQPPQEQITDSDITPDGSTPLLINKWKPDAPRGYMAVFVDGQWRVVPDPKYLMGKDNLGRFGTGASLTGPSGPGFGGGGGGGDTGTGMGGG